MFSRTKTQPKYVLWAVFGNLKKSEKKHVFGDFIPVYFNLQDQEDRNCQDMGISMIIYVVFSLFSIFYPFPQPFQIRFLTRPRLSSPHWLDSACQWSVIRGPFGRCHQKSIHAQSSRRGTSTCLRLRKSVNPLKN